MLLFLVISIKNCSVNIKSMLRHHKRLQWNAERDCIQVGPGVQIHQHKHSSQSLVSYASPFTLMVTAALVFNGFSTNLSPVSWISQRDASISTHIQSPVALSHANEYWYVLSLLMTKCSDKQAFIHLFGSAGAPDTATASNSLYSLFLE